MNNEKYLSESYKLYFDKYQSLIEKAKGCDKKSPEYYRLSKKLLKLARLLDMMNKQRRKKLKIKKEGDKNV